LQTKWVKIFYDENYSAPCKDLELDYFSRAVINSAVLSNLMPTNKMMSQFYCTKPLKLLIQCMKPININASLITQITIDFFG